MELLFSAARHGFEENQVLKKFAVANHQVEAGAIHVNHAARTNIQMADFAVAHLPIGQADPFAGSVDQRVRETFQEVVIIRLACEGDSVAFRFGAETPAIQDSQYDWSRSLGHGRSGYTEA